MKPTVTMQPYYKILFLFFLTSYMPLMKRDYRICTSQPPITKVNFKTWTGPELKTSSKGGD